MLLMLHPDVVAATIVGQVENATRSTHRNNIHIHIHHHTASNLCADKIAHSPATEATLRGDFISATSSKNRFAALAATNTPKNWKAKKNYICVHTYKMICQFVQFESILFVSAALRERRRARDF